VKVKTEQPRMNTDKHGFRGTCYAKGIRRSADIPVYQYLWKSSRPAQISRAPSQPQRRDARRGVVRLVLSASVASLRLKRRVNIGCGSTTLGRIAGFPTCGSQETTSGLGLARSADRNVGDTADRNVCATALGGRNLMQPWGAGLVGAFSWASASLQPRLSHCRPSALR
jgi:hypothetical protein